MFNNFIVKFIPIVLICLWTIAPSITAQNTSLPLLYSYHINWNPFNGTHEDTVDVRRPVIWWWTNSSESITQTNENFEIMDGGLNSAVWDVPSNTTFSWTTTFWEPQTFYYISTPHPEQRGILHVVPLRPNATEDQCPNNPDKLIQGNCGCDGVESDEDNNRNGILDCLEAPFRDFCELLSIKPLQHPGVCGCEEFDNDTDTDNIPDCVDLCPDSTDNGACGCGNSDYSDIPLTDVVVHQSSDPGKIQFEDFHFKLARIDQAGSTVALDEVLTFSPDDRGRLRVNFVFITYNLQRPFVETAKLLEFVIRWKIENATNFAVATKIKPVDKPWQLIDRGIKNNGDWTVMSAFIERDVMQGWNKYLEGYRIRTQILRKKGSGTIHVDYVGLRWVL